MAKKRQPSGKLSTRLQGGLLLLHDQAGELVEESVQYSSSSHIPFSVQSIDTVEALVREPHSESKNKSVRDQFGEIVAGESVHRGSGYCSDSGAARAS